MGDPAPKTRRAMRAFAIGAFVPLAMASVRSLDRGAGWRAVVWLDDALFRVLSGFPQAQVAGGRLLHGFHHALGASLGGAAFLAAFLLPLGFIARFLARARVRAGHADPLDRLRAWASAHAHAARAVVAAPALLFAWGFARAYHGLNGQGLAILAPPIALGAAVLFFLARAGLRELLAPTLDRDAVAKATIDADELVFDAVAVTRESKLAIAAVGAPALPLVVWIARLPLGALFRDPRPFWAFLAYALSALVAATLFQKASRVAVGIDGVYVHGTARTRFFAYRDLDGARLAGDDLVLVRKGRELLRLQLHGEDAARRDAVLARMVDAIAAAHDRRAVAAHRMVAGKSKDEVARVALGGGDYRAPSITRDQLWVLVEGSTTDASSRATAAEALTVAIDPAERARLRVAADRVADPALRAELARLAEVEDEPEATAPPRRGAVA